MAFYKIVLCNSQHLLQRIFTLEKASHFSIFHKLSVFFFYPLPLIDLKS